MARLTLVVVDDEQEILRALKRLFRNDFDIETFDRGADCLTYIEQGGAADIVLSDIRMPFMDGFALMEKIQQCAPDITRLCISGYADIDRCQQAIEQGLFKYIIPKPWDNFELKSIVQLFAENKQLKQQLALLSEQLEGGG